MDAQALIDTAEGGLQETEALLQRIRELAVQAASDTNSSADRAALDAEKTQLMAEIDRIANSTTWAGQNLLDGTFSNKNFQVGSGTMPMDSLSSSIAEMSVSGLQQTNSTSTSTRVIGSGTAIISIGVSYLVSENPVIYDNVEYAPGATFTGVGGVFTVMNRITDGSNNGTITSSQDLYRNINLNSKEDALNAITAMDAFLNSLNSQRASLGALSNRIDHLVSNNTNTATNIARSISRIEDADFAAETTNLAKQQILQQAATAMLAQANASKQNILTLLNL
jgi:flagellin